MCQQFEAFHTLILHVQARRDEEITEPSHEVAFIELLVKLPPRKHLSLPYDYLEKVKRLPPDFFIVMLQIPKKELLEVIVNLDI